MVRMVRKCNLYLTMMYLCVQSTLGLVGSKGHGILGIYLIMYLLFQYPCCIGLAQETAFDTWKYSKSSKIAETSEETTIQLAPPLKVDLWICAEIWLIAVINVWFQSF